MNGIRLFLATAAILPLALGCSGQATLDKSAQSDPATVASSGPKLAGKWQGKLEMPQTDKNDPGAAFAGALASMMGAMIELEFPDEKSFVFRIMGLPMTGPVKRTGNKIELVPEHVAGMTMEEASKNGLKMEGMNKPMTGTISDDGSEIKLSDNSGQKGEFVFKRKAVEKVEDKVSSADRAYVGTWKGEIVDMPSELKGKSKSEVDMAKAMMNNTSLELRSDYTFTMNMIMQIEGQWSVAGDEIKLKMTGIAGLPEGGTSKGDDIAAKIGKGGSELTLGEQGGKDGKFVFRKV